MNTIVVSKSNAELPIVENLKQLPDGQTLLLRPKVGRIVYNDDIYALKKNEDLYYSFIDIIDIFNLAIDYDEKTQKGQGWFLREDWQTQIDFENKSISTRGDRFIVSSKDIIERNNVLFVSGKSIEQWYSIKFTPDISQQYIEVESPHPLPTIAKNNRRNKRFSYSVYDNEAVLPRLETRSQWFDMNTLDVRLGSRLRRKGGFDSQDYWRHSGVFAAQGQFLKHNAYALANFDNDGGLAGAVTRLSKRDEDAVLLGPLKARSYMIGDTDITDIPLTGDARQELGFRVSNSPFVNSQFETTDINGDAIPGWDVELYRNGVLIDTLVIGETGQYEFSDTQLFAGDNNFELIFYGPQGEVRSKEVSMPVTAALLAAQNNVYDVSISLSETQTYKRNRAQEMADATPHIAARYNKTFGDMLAHIGFRNRENDGENETHVGLGFSRIVGNTLLDGNFGIDDAGEYATEIRARRKISGWDLAASALTQSDAFTPDGGDNPLKYKIATSAQRSFKPSNKMHANVFMQAEISESHQGQKTTLSQLGGSLQSGSASISNNIRYNSYRDASGSQDDRIDNALSARAILGKYFLRGGVDYDIYPQKKVDSYFAQVSYRPKPAFSGDLNFDYNPDKDYKTARLNLNFTNKHFKASPFIEVDSNDNIEAGINFNFSIMDDPNSENFDITSKRLSGRGLVSSFVYHDKNGNMVFDGLDEILPEVVVESVNVRRRVQTNENGYSMIDDLPTTRATDIHIDEATLPDSFMVAGFEGVSVLPEAGEIVELEFPVHMAGEIDGTILLRNEHNKNEPIRRAAIDLYPLGGDADKVINVRAASDGFFVASQIPPGKYLVAVNNNTMKKAGAGAPAPKIIDIGYDGETIYGMDLALDSTKPVVPIQVSYRRDDVVKEEVYRIKTDSKGGTRLASLLTDFAKQRYGDTIDVAALNANISPAAGGDNLGVSAAANDPVALYEQCQNLAQSAIPCALEVIIPVN